MDTNNDKSPKDDFEELKEFKHDMKSILKKIHKFIMTGDEYGNSMTGLSDKIINLTKKSWCQEENLILLMNQYAQTLRRITTLQKEMMNKIQNSFNVPIFNYLEHDFHELREMKNKKDKVELEYTKLSTKKQNNTDISTVAAIGKELGRVKTTLDEANENFEEALDALNSKKTVKFAQVLKETIHSQEDFYVSTTNSMSELDPFVKRMEQNVKEENEEDSKLYMEGFLRKMRDPNKTISTSFRRAWVVLKPGFLHTYKGKEAKIKSRSISLLISTVKMCGTKVDPKDKKNLYLFEVISPGTKKIVLGCKTEIERANWIKAISDIISNSLDQQVLPNTEVSEKLNTQTIENEEVFFKLQNVPGNKFCADCNSPDPKWASSNLGILICVDCSGVHRSLGTHISRVRSTMLDQWSTDLIYYMERIGNQKSNEWFERNTKDYTKPTPESDRNSRELYISAKYKELLFVSNTITTSPQTATDTLHKFCSKETKQTKLKIPLLSHNMFNSGPTATDLLSKYYGENKKFNVNVNKGDSGVDTTTDEEDEDSSDHKQKVNKQKLLKKTSEMSGSTQKLAMYKQIFKEKLERNTESSDENSGSRPIKRKSSANNGVEIHKEKDQSDVEVDLKRSNETNTSSMGHRRKGSASNLIELHRKNSGNGHGSVHNSPTSERKDSGSSGSNGDILDSPTSIRVVAKDTLTEQIYDREKDEDEKDKTNNENSSIGGDSTNNSANNSANNSSVDIFDSEDQETYFVVSLIRQGADPNWQDPISLKSSLHQACINDRHESLFALIMNGGDLSKQDILGWTPLHYIAANSSGTNLCTQLLSRSTGLIQKNYLEIKDYHGRDALVVATKQNNQAFINFCKSFVNKTPMVPRRDDLSTSPRENVNSISPRLNNSQTLKLDLESTKNNNNKKSSGLFKKDKHKSALFTSRRAPTNETKKGGSIRFTREKAEEYQETENEKLSRDIAALDINLNLASPFASSDDEMDDHTNSNSNNIHNGINENHTNNSTDGIVKKPGNTSPRRLSFWKKKN